MCVKLVIYGSHRWGWGGGIPSKGNSSNLMTWRQYCLDPQTRESVWNSGCSKLRDEHRSGGGGKRPPVKQWQTAVGKTSIAGMQIHTERHAEKETWSVCAHLPYPLKGAITPHTKRPTVLPGFRRRANLTGSNLQSGVRQEERFLKTRYRKIVLLCAVANLRTFLSLTLSPPFCSSLQTEQGK